MGLPELYPSPREVGDWPCSRSLGNPPNCLKILPVVWCATLGYVEGVRVVKEGGFVTRVSDII